MSNQIHIDGDTRAGTIGGTLVVILLNLFMHDAVRSILLAVVGATTSFFISFSWKLLLKYFQLRCRKRMKGEEKHE